VAAFFSEVLDEFLTPAFLEGVCGKFHYEEAQSAELRAVAEKMLPLMREEAFWESKRALAGESRQAENPDAVYEYVVMSLGKGIDCLQEKYGEKLLLSESYMIEALASELLIRGYDAYNCYIRKNTKWHVARYHFLGSEEAFPLEMLPGLLRELTKKVSCNSAFCMVPKKSVAFVSELTQDESVYCRGICVGCNRIQCPNRIADDSSERKRIADMPLTYGYSRIFGVSR